MNPFQQKLAQYHLSLTRANLQTLQINLGRRCNQACRHCHVDAGPWRTEMMTAPVATRVADWIRQFLPTVVDITGGAPELNENFSFLVEIARNAGSRVIDRCNLTILEEPGFNHLPRYLAHHQVEIIASLPCYSPENVAQQRGQGVFEKSISALQQLNILGYGTQIPLHLVYNPVGPKLPPPQPELELDYKQTLKKNYGIVFHRLLTLTNQPIARFANHLRANNQWQAYLDLLTHNFNPHTVPGLMCRNTLSVDYLGAIYDCDFNQMLTLQIQNGHPLFLWDVTPQSLQQIHITTGFHCLACTAGAGSSCAGALTTPQTP